MYLHFKVASYKYYQGDHSRLKVLYLPRDTKSIGRQLLNVEEMEAMIQSMTVWSVGSLNRRLTLRTTLV